MIYVANLASIVVYGIILFMERNSRELQRVFCVICFLQLFLIAALRFNVGADYASYATAYITISHSDLGDLGMSNWLAPGFTLLCKLISLFVGDNYLWMYAIISFLTIIFIIKSVYENSVDVFLSIFLFIAFCLYNESFNQSRQLLAISITVYSLRYIKEENIKRFLLCVLGAASIHYSAIIFIAAYWFAHKDVSLRNTSQYIMLAILAFVFADFVFYILSFTPYRIYFGTNNIEFRGSVIVNTIYRILLHVVCLILAKTIQIKGRRVNILYNMGFLCLVLQIIALKSYMFARVSTYFYVFYIFLIPEVVHSIKNKYLKVITYISVIILYSIYAFAYSSLKEAEGLTYYTQYQSIFSSDLLK